MDIQTPSLLLDLNKLERNIEMMTDFAKQHAVDYRPHIKTHKSIDIAKMQIDAGAIGITVATVGEAEVMVDGGIDNILIAFPIAQKEKIERIKQLRKRAHIIVTVDSIEQVEMLANEVTSDHPLPLWMKINSGLNRVGVEPNEEALQLARTIKKFDQFILDGILTHAGHAYGAHSKEEIKRIGIAEAQSLLDVVRLCEESGIAIPNRSVGSTPTFQISGAVEGITEIRPGNAAFFDMVQVGLGVTDTKHCALTVRASIASVKKDRLVMDAGSKTLALDKGAHGNDSIKGHGYIKEYPTLVIERLSEEHGVIPVTDADVNNIQINDEITIIPNHACVVANLFDQYIVHREGRYITTWPVHARGKLV